MICPACDGDTKVVDSRPNARGIHRRRACAHCGLRFSTQERVTTRAIPRADTPQPATKAGNRKKLAAYKAARVKLERLGSPEKARGRAKRQRLRAEARKQAEQEGVAPEVIYARWQL